VEKISDYRFSGGVKDPVINNNLKFVVHKQELDENGILNPVENGVTLKGSFQINLTGNSDGYKEIGKYFLALAELDSSQDPDFHEHLDDIISEDGKTHFDIIIRKSVY